MPKYWPDTHTDTQTDRQRDTQTYRQQTGWKQYIATPSGGKVMNAEHRILYSQIPLPEKIWTLNIKINVQSRYCVFLVSAHSCITGLPVMHTYNSWWWDSTSCFILIMAIVHIITNTINGSKLYRNDLHNLSAALPYTIVYSNIAQLIIIYILHSMNLDRNMWSFNIHVVSSFNIWSKVMFYLKYL